jgi:hypothetical protein
MRYLLRILNHFKPKEIPKPVGRWNNECNIKTNKKIDFSNEDHCGPCGENLLFKDKFKETKYKD